MNSLVKTDEMEVDDPDSVTICRLCAEMTSTKSFLPLYTDDKREQPVVKQINRLVNNLISPNDGLPQDVCLTCAENVDKFYSFVSNIIQTQNKLRRLMQLPQIKEIGANEESQQISFLHDDDASPYALTHADDGPEIIPNKDTNIRLNGNSKFTPSKENKTRTEGKSLGITIHQSVAKKTASAALDSQSVSGDRLANIRKIYRCSSCDAKFNTKEDCLRHIVNSHANARKTISKNTIFEKLPPSASPGSRQPTEQLPDVPIKFKELGTIVQKKTQQPTVTLLSSIGSQGSKQQVTSSSNKVTRVSSQPIVSSSNSVTQTSTQSTANSTPKPNSLSRISTTPATPSTDASQPPGTSEPAKSTPDATSSEAKDQSQPQPKKRHRKVLSIDGFYREITKTKEAVRYICDVCGRSMVSTFAFARHLREHDWSDEETDEDSSTKEKNTSNKSSKPSTSGVVPKPKIGYCSYCKALVSNSVRHKAYHTINDLEKAHPNSRKLLNFP